MNADNKKRGLGRGLDALFRDVKKDDSSFATKHQQTPAQKTVTPSAAPAATPSAPSSHAPVKRADEIVKASSAIKAEPQTSAASVTSGDIETKAAKSATNAVRQISVTQLKPGTFQPRRVFDDAEIAHLAESIKAHGILQPILARVGSDVDTYEIIAGERRWRAAQAASLHNVPVILRDMTDQQALEFGLIENLQRVDLTPVDEALGYQRLVDDFSYTQEKIAKQLGKSRSHVANILRLLTLPADVQVMLNKGQLTAGHARPLIGHPHASSIAAEIVKKGLSVRAAEKLCRPKADPKNGVTKNKIFVRKDVDTLALEKELSTLLGLNVQIEPKDELRQEGQLTIDYKTLDQLDDVINRLKQGPRVWR